MDELDIQHIKKLCEEKRIQWTNHILVRLLQRDILQEDVENAIKTGEIIEYYPDDYPNPSCLILGTTVSGKQLHIVCGICDDVLWMITAYYPDSTIWKEDYKTRIEGGTKE